MTRRALDLTLLGVGAMNSPRFAPAGLLVAYAGRRVVIDGGPGAEPSRRMDAWLVTDEHSELRGPLRRLAAEHGLEPRVAAWHDNGLTIEPKPVVHTSHPTVGYLVEAPGRRAAWAPEFWTFPEWVAGVDLLFADAAGWNRPIRFARGVGGHAAALDIADAPASGCAGSDTASSNVGGGQVHPKLPYGFPIRESKLGRFAVGGQEPEAKRCLTWR